MSYLYRAPIYASYRRLYRARIALFRGDDHAMRESRKEVQKQYRLHGEQPLLTTTTNATNASANESAAPSLVELLAMADEAADMLRNSIVQSKLNAQTGHYEAKLKAHHVTENTGSSGQPPLLEPLTPKVVASMEQKGSSSAATVKVEQHNSTTRA